MSADPDSGNDQLAGRLPRGHLRRVLDEQHRLRRQPLPLLLQHRRLPGHQPAHDLAPGQRVHRPGHRHGRAQRRGRRRLRRLRRPAQPVADQLAARPRRRHLHRAVAGRLVGHGNSQLRRPRRRVPEGERHRPAGPRPLRGALDRAEAAGPAGQRGRAWLRKRHSAVRRGRPGHLADQLGPRRPEPDLHGQARRHAVDPTPIYTTTYVAVLEPAHDRVHRHRADAEHDLHLPDQRSRPGREQRDRQRHADDDTVRRQPIRPPAPIRRTCSRPAPATTGDWTGSPVPTSDFDLASFNDLTISRRRQQHGRRDQR